MTSVGTSKQSTDLVLADIWMLFGMCSCLYVAKLGSHQMLSNILLSGCFKLFHYVCSGTETHRVHFIKSVVEPLGQMFGYGRDHSGS